MIIKKSVSIVTLICLLLITGLFVFNSCNLINKTSTPGMSPTIDLFGTAAFSDKPASLVIKVPVTSDIKTLLEVTGHMTYEGVTIGIIGTYDDETGSIEAIAAGMVNGLLTEFTISGIYDVEAGEFTGEITRTIDGGITEIGVFASVTKKGKLGIEVYLGTFGSSEDPTSLGTWNLVINDDEVFGTFWHSIDNYGGTMEGTSTKNDITITNIISDPPYQFIVEGHGGGIKEDATVNGWYEVTSFLGFTAAGSWVGDYIEVVLDPYLVWDGDYEINEPEDLRILSVYSEVTGNLTITGSSLINLKGLEGLDSIGGNLTISHNSELIHLQGLEDLASVGGDIDINNNEKLVDLKGLSGLAELDGSLSIQNNLFLKNLDGLDNLVEINGDLTIDVNPLLGKLDGLRNLIVLDGFLRITDNEILKEEDARALAGRWFEVEGLIGDGYDISGNGQN
jgi:hypothetical protein